MGNLSREQNEILSFIDAILTMIEKTPKWGNGVNVNVNPFDLLLSIIGKFATYDEIINWLAKSLTYLLPTVELGVKGVLLAQLKKTIDCNNDPRIPNKFRKEIYSYTDNLDYNNNREKRGVLLNINSIDGLNILSVSPLSGRGYMHYFGTKSYYTIIGDEDEDKYHVYMDAVNACRKKGLNRYNIVDKSEINNVYELARADDFNAFLWFIIHKAKFRYPKIIDSSISDFFRDNGITSSVDDISTNLTAFDGEIDLTKDKPIPPFFPGDVILQMYNKTNNGNVLSLCLNSKNSKVNTREINYGGIVDSDLAPETISACADMGKCHMTFVPVSSDNFSANWYVDRRRYFDFLSPKKEQRNINNRDYSSEFAICNLAYVPNSRPNDSIRFTVMPKPMVHLPHKGEPIWRVKKILFNANGEPDKNGKYSVHPSNGIKTPNLLDGGEFYEYSLELGFKLRIRVDDGSYFLLDENNNEVSSDNFNKVCLTAILYECYPGLTVYEFNYDFVMGMKLFDPVVISSRLITMITNMKYGNISFGYSKSESKYTMGLQQAIANILESDAYEVSDCFYTFDNNKYDAMLRDSELKKANLYPFNKNGVNEARKLSNGKEVEDILNSYDENATLQERQDTIKRAINKATKSVTEEILPEDRYNWHFNIVLEMVKSYITIIVESILSPKIMVLLEVNRQLYGDNGEKIDLEDLFKSLEGIIIAIIMEIRDLILKELLDWVMEILSRLFIKLGELLLKEQIEFYTRLIKQLIKSCSFKVKHRKPLENKLDVVDYSDIDDIERPLESKC